MPKPKLTKRMIDFLVPEHTVLRYEKSIICNDENLAGGFRREIAPKEWRCKRCCLLQIAQNDLSVPDDVTLDLEVNGWGNIL